MTGRSASSMRRPGVACLVALTIGCAAAPAGPTAVSTELSPVVASADWPVSTPVAEGLDPDRVRDLVVRLRRAEYGSVSSLLVVRHGRLIVEEYFNGWSASQPHTMQSVSKSVTSLITGIAIDRRRLTTADRVTSFFPSYAPLANDDSRKQAMSIRDLLTMRTGLDWSEDPIAGSPLLQLNACRCDWLRFVLDWKMRESPGTRWEYVSGGVIVLGGAVSAAVEQRVDLFGDAQLFAPLGIERAFWIGGLPDGLPHTGGGLYLRPRDMAKIGQLVLDRGTWRGATVISGSWIDESTRPVLTNVRMFGPRPADYGYLWWRLPGGVITAAGARGQWIFAAPSVDLVMTATGENDATFLSAPDFFYSRVLTAIR